MKGWNRIPWSSFSECWVSSQLFHSPISSSSRGSLIPLCFLLYGWCHLHIWGYWYFSRQSWFQLVLHSVYRNPESKPRSRFIHVSIAQVPCFRHLMQSCGCETGFAKEPACLQGDGRLSLWPSCPLWVCGQITGPQDPREPQSESQITLEKRLSNTFVIFIYRLILQVSWQTNPLLSSLSKRQQRPGWIWADPTIGIYSGTYASE